MKRKFIQKYIGNNRGELSVLFTLAAMGLIVLGTLAVKAVQKNTQDIRTGAITAPADKNSCVPLQEVFTQYDDLTADQTLTNHIVAGRPFRCYIKTKENVYDPQNIVCAIGTIQQPGDVCHGYDDTVHGIKYGFQGYIKNLGDLPDPNPDQSKQRNIAVFNCNTNGSKNADYSADKTYTSGTKTLFGYDFRITPAPTGPYCGSGSGLSTSIIVDVYAAPEPTSTVPSPTINPGTTATPVGNICSVDHDLKYCTKTGGSCCSDWGVGIGCSTADADRQFEYCRDNCQIAQNTSARICQGYVPATRATVTPKASTTPVPLPTIDPYACIFAPSYCNGYEKLTDFEIASLPTGCEAKYYAACGRPSTQTGWFLPGVTPPALSCTGITAPSGCIPNPTNAAASGVPTGTQNAAPPTATPTTMPPITDACTVDITGSKCSVENLLTYLDPISTTDKPLFTRQEAEKLSRICWLASNGVEDYMPGHTRDQCTPANTYPYGLFQIDFEQFTGCKGMCTTNPVQGTEGKTQRDYCVSENTDMSANSSYMQQVSLLWKGDDTKWPENWKTAMDTCKIKRYE